MIRNWKLRGAVGLFVAAIAMPASAEPAISWRVENPFRFFTDPADTEVHRATFAALTNEELRSPVLAAERALAQRHPDGWSASMYRKICWNWTRNRHVCPEVADYIHPKGHRIVAEMVDIEDAQSVDCVWTTAPIGGRQRGTTITLPCDTPVKLDVPYPSGAQVSVEIGGRLIAEKTVKVRDLFIVGIGDSFASGEGNPDVPVRFSPERTATYGASKAAEFGGYPARVGDWRQIGDAKFIEENARWVDQACHRSHYSYQLRTALQIAVERPDRAVTYVGFACSGAETTFGLFLRYKGNEWVPNPPDLPQISAVAEAQCGTTPAKAYDLPEAYHMNERVPELKGGLVLRKCDADKARRIDLVLLSLGGNDIGFSRLVANAVLSDESQLRRLGGWIGQVHGFKDAQDQLDRLDDRYKAVNRALHSLLHVPWNESDRIVLTGYPPLAVREDGTSICPDGRSGMDVLADFNLSEIKAREGEAAAQRLHDVMRDAAVQHHWTFVEAHRNAFRGRGICAGLSGDGASPADDLRVPRFVDGRWQPVSPSDWHAYAPRQRWFRTPNDAFMTGNFHVSQSILQNVLKTQTLLWMQLLLASTYSGAFHPTAEGQAAIADAVVEKARTVLERHEGRQR